MLFLFLRKLFKILEDDNMKKWDELPEYLQLDEIKPYYEYLQKKKLELYLKRCFDIVMSIMLLLLLMLPMVIISLVIVMDNKGPVFYRQERVTQYGKRFRIHKFRTMIVNADHLGTAVTVEDDPRVTAVGSLLRKYRLDEIPQLLDILVGDMSFVGTRPESVKYVEKYQREYYATLLMKAGVTSEASIVFKDEAKLLSNESNIDEMYVQYVLPQKMDINLKSILNFSILSDIKTMLRTVYAVFM